MKLTVGRPTADGRPPRIRKSAVGRRSSVIDRRGDLTLAIAAGLLALLLLWLGFIRAWPLTLDVGVQDDRFVTGFNETEDFAGRLVRWTDGDATIALPRPPDG